MQVQTAENGCSECSENVCDNNYETDYEYKDQFHVQNVVKKPGCETFDIDFGENKRGFSAAKRPKPELTKGRVL